MAFVAGAAIVLLGALPAQAHVSFTSEKVSKVDWTGEPDSPNPAAYVTVK